MLADCRTADYVVDIAGYCQDLVQAKLLRDLGFEPAPEMAPELSCYRICARRRLVRHRAPVARHSMTDRVRSPIGPCLGERTTGDAVTDRLTISFGIVICRRGLLTRPIIKRWLDRAARFGYDGGTCPPSLIPYSKNRGGDP